MVAWTAIIGMASIFIVAGLACTVLHALVDVHFEKVKRELSEKFGKPRMDQLREQARREGRYQELPSPEYDAWNRQLGDWNQP